MAADDIGEAMSFGEALQLIEILSQDPESWLRAGIAGWDHPASREFFALADLFDAFAKVNFKRPQPYQRPTPDKSTSVERLGERIDPIDIADVLRAFGREVPDGLDDKPPPDPSE
jgi:hypothetical protein